MSNPWPIGWPWAKQTWHDPVDEKIGSFHKRLDAVAHDLIRIMAHYYELKSDWIEFVKASEERRKRGGSK
jgi:hypothetical protein